MHIFKELLQETKLGLAEKLKAIYDGVSPSRAEKAKQALGNLEKAIEADTIFNVDFNEIKDVLSRCLEESLRQHSFSSTKDDSSPHLMVYHADISSYVYLNQAKTQSKKIKDFLAKNTTFPSADKALLEKMLATNEAAAEVNVLMTSLKSKIVKGRKPNVNVDPNAFHSKLGSAEAQKKVKEALELGVKEPLDDYEEAIRSWLQRYIDTITKSDTYTQPKDRSHRDGLMDMIFMKCFDSDRDHSDKSGDTVFKNVKIDPDKKDFAKTDAKSQRDNIELRYLAKNIKKLSHVVDLKGNLSKIETLEYRKPKIASGGGTLESGFKFIFADGSEFTVINKIVTKYSYTGTRFEQFPTTFHDVKFPDGTKMKMPSEEKMVKEFGSWKPNEV